MNTLSKRTPGLLLFIGMLGACRSAVATPLQVTTDSLIRDTVRYQSGVVSIAATLLRPRTAASGAAVVIVHGSGPSARDNPWTTAWAEALASHGVAVLYPDKRGSGGSSGDWRAASIRDLADDAAAGVAWLRRRPEIDTSRVGVIGFSQGGYIASILAADEPRVAFTAAVSGGTASLMVQMVDEIVAEAEQRGAPLTDTEAARLRRVYERAFAFIANGRGWEDYLGELTQDRASGGALAFAVRTLPPDSTHWAFAWLRHMGDFDPMPYWRRATRPVALVYGGADTKVRVDESIHRLERLDRATRARFDVVRLGGNGHALFREDVVALLAAWMRSGGAH